MGIVFRQSIKTSIVVFSGAFLGVAVMWLSTRYIGKQQLGFTGNLTTYAIVLAQIFLTGLSSTLAVYIYKYAMEDIRRKVLITLCLVIPLAFAIVATIPFFFLKAWVLKHFQPGDMLLMERYYCLLPVYTILFILQIMLEQYLALQMKVAIAAFMREVVVRVVSIALIILFAFNYINFDVFVVGSILTYLIPVSIFIFLALRTEGFGLSFKISSFSKAEYKELIHFSWYHFLLLLSVTFMGFLDAILLPLYNHDGFEAVAVYRIAVFIMSFLQMPSKAMLMPTVSVLSQAISSNDTAKAKNIFTRSSINVLIATWFMAIVIACNLTNAVDLIQKGYSAIVPLFLILFVGRIVDLATGLNDAILSITKYYKFSFYTSVVMIALLFVLLKVWVPVYGLYGAAWASSVTLIVFNICKYIFVWKKLGMQPFSSKTMLVIVAGLPALAAGYFFPHFFSSMHVDRTLTDYIYTLVDVGIRSTIIVVVYMAMLLWLRPSADLDEYIASIRRNKRLF